MRPNDVIPGVSVIVCCYNSALRLPETIKYLALQEVPKHIKWEVIIVNNASKDNTSQKAIEEWGKYKLKVPFSIVDQPDLGLVNARNKGVAASKYEFCLFCDDDNWLNKNYISLAYTIMEKEPMIGILGGVGEEVCEIEPPYWFEKYKGLFAVGHGGKISGDVSETGGEVYGAGMVIRKSVYLQLIKRGFKSKLVGRKGSKLSSGEDTELCYVYKLEGYKIWYDENLNFHHYLPSSRLTNEYLIRLNKALSFCSGSLFVYKYVLNGKEITRDIWYKDLAYQFLFFVKSLLHFLFFNGPFIEKRLIFDFSLNRLWSVLCQFKKYRLNYIEVKNLKRKGLTKRKPFQVKPNHF